MKRLKGIKREIMGECSLVFGGKNEVARSI